jgi:hypothetical protein
MNQINIINPYYHNGWWVFDDEKVGLTKEPFVAGMPIIIEKFIELKNIKNAKQGFTIIFSKDYFPNADIVLEKVKEDGGGNWYTIGGMEGWLCPALFRYFDVAPKKIYVRLENL